MNLPTVDVWAVVLLNRALMASNPSLFRWEFAVLRSMDSIVARILPVPGQAAVVSAVASRAKRALLFEELRRGRCT